MAGDSDYNGYVLEIVITVFLVLTFITVLLRCYARIGVTKVFELDDLLIVISQVIFTLSCSFILVGLRYGIGRHNWDLSTGNQIQAMKYQVLSTFTYIASMTSIKMSIAVFLLRLASKKSYIWTIWLSIVIVLIWSIIILFYDIFQCIPVEAQWNFEIPNAKCITGNSFAAAVYSISIMSIVTDWLYALLPIPMIWGVRMVLKTKVTVAIILSLGIFASLATIIRMRYIMMVEELSDILYTGTQAMVWTIVEPGVAIIAASLFTIRPLLRCFNHSEFDSGFDTGFDSNDPTTISAQPLSLRSGMDLEVARVNSVNSNGSGDRRYRATESWRELKTSPSESHFSREAGSEEWILRNSPVTRPVDARVESRAESRAESEGRGRNSNS